MKRLTTFEDIFNKLIKEYKGKRVEIQTSQNGVPIASLTTRIEDIVIKPVNRKKIKKWNSDGRKIGLMVIQEKNKQNRISIPFKLGYNTMEAIFLKNGVTIKSLDMKFIIKRYGRKKRLA
ncbi:hypothetical protein [Halothermothrix orenii]|uniref:Uncharacterized protein n=1 Tax=Halothermothrix orenii (strain H 168 / OCM 544 / DSM 9562) TaxID=373903 RepID=B8D0L0_HALOH|nr:hypothetical protein [Halothermothrix orenii]ACL70946.1 hypothetical protein Hore_22010 [Halothermothrix orenii H 168]